ncbi:MAG: DUF262 domain-containing protein [Bacteroidetes bacterium]|nr:DUF262 domain-containing protein [Bacteroidota bacterium]
MQEYRRETITNVIDAINKNYFLPDIQRDFVWRPEQIYKLFDSLLRGYPIGTFLFWRLSGEFLQAQAIKKLEFVKRSDEHNRENTEINSEREYWLVLDGQQRLTSFYLVLKGNYIIRSKPYELYFNLLSGVEEDDEILYEFKFYNRDKGDTFLEESKNSNPKLWFRVKDIYDVDDPEDLDDKLDERLRNKSTGELTKGQIKSVKRLHRLLTAEPVINFYPEKEESYDKVLDIFVRTNSGGTQLSYSDLLFSTFKLHWPKAREEFGALLQKLNDNDRYCFDNDFILKTILVLNARDIESIRYKTKNFGKALIQLVKQEEYWKRLGDALRLTVDMIQQRLFLTHSKLISSNNALIPIVYVLFKNETKGFGAEKHCLHDDDIMKIRIWLVKALLTGTFAGQSDTILGKCKQVIDSSADFFPAREIESTLASETKKNMRLNWDLMKDVEYNDKSSHLILSVCYKSAVNFMPRMKGNLPEQDHIFSQRQLKEAKVRDSKINSIFNLRLIGADENRTKTDKDFEDWVKEIGNDKRELEKHLIPEGDWNVSNFDEFLRQRKFLFIKNSQY